MSQENDIPPNRGIVPLDEIHKRRIRERELVRKADERIPDEVWLKLQECGEEAVNHLYDILKSPGFQKRKIHEQVRVIELALTRAYGAPEGSFKRPPKDETPDDPRRIAQGDSIRRLANQARLPELGIKRANPLKGDLPE